MVSARTPLPPFDPDAAFPSAEAATASLLRVLVVDNDADTADSFALLIKRWGYDVLSCYSAAEAQRLANACEPDVALIDIGLPVTDGYHLARWFRGEPRMGPTQLIAVTGFGQETDRRRSQEAGFDLHLVKPVNPRQLREVLAERAARKQRPMPQLAP